MRASTRQMIVDLHNLLIKSTNAYPRNYYYPPGGSPEDCVQHIIKWVLSEHTDEYLDEAVSDVMMLCELQKRVLQKLRERVRYVAKKDRNRQRKVKNKYVYLRPVNSVGDPSEHVRQAELVDSVRYVMMTKLSTSEHMVITLKFTHNMTGPEAATLLDISIDAYYGRVKRAMASLKTKLKKAGINEDTILEELARR